ncbi:TonB-dependent receptor [Desertivirga brevis]|uniref:TonB-dependent receptor n=1 Tax=Desertivirga brevis TaxID=2810310 RepID=UPI001A95C6A4|nr:TonB-dependent receptor [Pedobacter sp. SYSU D00873]
MIFRILLLSFLALLNLSNLFAQKTAAISGTVKTPDNQPIEHVWVTLKGKSKNTVTDAAGKYRLSGLQPGTYAVRISSMELNAQEQQVIVQAGEIKELNFTVSLSEVQLKAVEINSRKTNSLNAKKSETVARMPLQNLENPQVYVSIPKELLELQVVTNFNDALKNSPGLDKLWSSTGRAGDGAGYYSLRGFSVQPNLVNGIAGLTNGDLDPANIEKIEVIKGPSGTLFGGALTSFGGLINIVTKRPVDSLTGALAYTTGSFGLNRITADVNTPVSKDKRLIARLNGAYHYQNSFQDAGFRKSLFIAPSFEYNVNERFKLNLDLQFYNYEGTNPLSVFLNRSRSLIARTPADLNLNFNRSFTSNDLTIQTPANNLFAQANYKLSSAWTLQTNLSRSYRKSDGFYQYVMFLGTTDDVLSRMVSRQNSISTSTDIQENLIGDFKIAGLRNRIVAGVDVLRLENNNNNSPYITFDAVSTSNNKDANYTKINRISVESKINASTGAYARNSSVNNVYSAYASDVLNITDKLMAMASLRVDRFDNRGTYNQSTDTLALNSKYAQTAVSPKFGLVYQVVKDQVSVFGNYMNGFRNVAPVVQPAGISGNLKPQQANQIEGGVKLDVFRNRLSVTASYYDISVSNLTRSETITIDGTPQNYTVQDGTQKSKGFELDIVANPMKGMDIFAGFSHNESKMTKSDASVLGRRPVTAGPENLVNGWVNYTFTSGKIKNFGIGFGGNYASKNMVTNTVATGTFTLPAYTVLNATAFYTTKSYRWSLKVDNLSGEVYYKGWTTVERQQPRSLLASMSYKF